MPRKLPPVDQDYGPDVVEEGDQRAEIEEAAKALAGLSTVEVLRLLHRQQLIQYLAKLNTVGLTPPESAILARLMKDNGMFLGVPPEAQEARHPPQAPLPEFRDPDYLQ